MRRQHADAANRGIQPVRNSEVGFRRGARGVAPCFASTVIQAARNNFLSQVESLSRCRKSAGELHVRGMYCSAATAAVPWCIICASKFFQEDRCHVMRSVQRILAVFESFTAERSSLALQEIADRIELPKSTTFRIVQSLEQAGYLVRLEDQKYCLSLRFTRLGGLVKSTLGIREIARPVMAELAEATKETVSIHTVSGRNRVCIDAMATASSQLRNVVQPGEQVALLSGSGSKVLMAFMPKAQLATITGAIARRTKRAQTEVLAELAKIRQQGFAVSHGERLLGLSAISAPIKDATDAVRYCITTGGPTVRMQANEKEFIKLVVKAAANISRQFGGRTN
ncbi:MAG: IclR family transcriptional regulator [Burkholderiales bacterium]